MKNLALNHLVFSELLALLPVASERQVLSFQANLKLFYSADAFKNLNLQEYSKEIEFYTPAEKLARRKNRDLLFQFRLGRVSLSCNETAVSDYSQAEIEQILENKFGDNLEGIAGFWCSGGRWRLKLPENCFLFPYYSDNPHVRLIRGVLCSPFDRLDYYFLLSSARLRRGARALPMSDEDKEFYSKGLLETTFEKIEQIETVFA